MTQSEQMKLVLLYALNELGGGGKRFQVLQHINDSRYWHKNDANDVRGITRPTEPKWRNDFSYERQHLVAAGYMQAGGGGNWYITGQGRAYLNELAERAGNIPAGEPRLFTLEFYQRLVSAALPAEAPALAEEEEEARYIARVAAEDMDAASAPAAVSNEPERKRPSHMLGSRRVYPRDPAVARRALARANHL